MRLLDVHTKSLEAFIGDKVPKYAILSHTWGEEEVSLQDLERNDCVDMLGYAKVDGCCRLAAGRDLRYVWVDTCSIDKTSSAELSEAMNSMFRWYQQSEICYVYLSDVAPGEDPYLKHSAFRRSRWFTRGWTLQELLAPHAVQFFDMTWQDIGIHYDRFGDYGDSMHEDRLKIGLLHDITKIDRKALASGFISNHTVAEKLSWAAGRSTTRVEDTAYCLLGLVGVNMPLLYGEGTKAFIRLQEHIMSSSDDHSLLTWGLGLPSGDYFECGKILASSPEAFKKGAGLRREIRSDDENPSHFMMTNRGLNIELPVFVLHQASGISLALLSCIEEHPGPSGVTRLVALPLLRKRKTTHVYERLTQSQPIFVPCSLLKKSAENAYLHREQPHGLK